jgi:ATP-binding protein involved in chromosome partitioning
MADKVHLPVKGIIENMSWFTGDDGKRYELFGAGGGQLLADELGVPLLGQLPLVAQLREGGDDGHPITAVNPEAEISQAFQAIAHRIATELKPRKVFSPSLKIIG